MLESYDHTKGTVSFYFYTPNRKYLVARKGRKKSEFS